jgi:hypothetical protein
MGLFKFLNPIWLIENYLTLHLGTIGSVVGIASGVSSIFGGSDSGGGNTAGGGYYDPYAAERPQYFKGLQTLMGQGEGGNQAAIKMVTNSPTYMGRLQQGKRTLNAGLARTGQTESGAEKLALSNYGQDYFNQQYQNLYNQYSGLSKATDAPLSMANTNALNASQDQNAWKAIAGGVQGLSGVFNSSSSGGNSNASPGIQLGGYTAPTWNSSSSSSSGVNLSNSMPASWATIGGGY